MNGKGLNCVDLFAGAGGFSLAAKNIGLNVAAAVEMNKHACETYKANIIKGNDSTKLYQKNILELAPEEIKQEHFNNGVVCDIVLGGPPCQGFSVHRINDAGVDDPRNQLILRYFEYVDILKPKIFLMENVPGILWPRHKKFLDAFYAEGSKAGYQLQKPITVDARDYGLPQRRKRVFILGIRSDIEFCGAWPPSATHGSPKSIEQNPQLMPWHTAEQIFNLPLPGNDENDRHMQHSAELIEVFKSTRLNRSDSNRVLQCHKKHNGHSDVYGRIDPTQPGPTMTTACINPSKGRFVHPIEHHGITVRQAARFQTFPDWFVFKGGLIAAGEQIGNAVPVKLGEILLSSIAEGLTINFDSSEQKSCNRQAVL